MLKICTLFTIQSHFYIGIDIEQDTRLLGFRPESVFSIGRWMIWRYLVLRGDTFELLVYKNQREPFQFLELQQQRSENVWPLKRLRRTWKDNIKMYLTQTECVNVDWIYLTEERVQWQTLVNAVIVADGCLLPDYTALQPRTQPSSYSPQWEPEILRGNCRSGSIRGGQFLAYLNYYEERICSMELDSYKYCRWGRSVFMIYGSFMYS
jgi:hypothetical protein